jgi:hypothetical protein
MKSPFLATVAILAMSPLLSSGQETKQDIPPAEREAHWRDDIKFMVDGLSVPGHTFDLQHGLATRGQIDFLKLYPADSFNAGLKTLDADIPKLSDTEIVLALMRLMASANVAHNGVQTPIGLGFFARVPLEFHWYSDGMAVTAASPEYSSALGAHVVSIGGKTPDRLLSEVAPYVSHENDTWLRQAAAGFLRSATVLDHFGVLGSDGLLSLTLQKPGAAPFTLSVKPGDPRVKRQSLIDSLDVPAPLFLSKTGTYYWHQYLSDSQTLFIQYNVCENDPKLSFADFARQVLADADSHTVQRVVIDLRLNSGGNSSIINPLMKGLESRLKQMGHLYVFIGPSTFSSGMDNAMDLRKNLHATLVGEPTGGKPSSYGEVKTLTLPNSKLVVRYTSKWFGSHDDSSPSLQPDLSAPRALTDVLAGRDPVLEAVFAADRKLTAGK